MSYQYVYYTALVDNLDQEDGDDYDHEPNLVFNEQRDTPIIKNCEDYEFAIETFKLDLKTLPAFIPTILHNYGPLDTIYTVRIEATIEILGVPKIFGTSERVIFSPQDTSIPQPQQINGYANYSTGFYNIYNYEYFLILVNNAIKQCVINLKADLVELGDTTVYTDYAPYFYFDKASKLISLYAPRDGFESKLSICLNKPLYRLFNSLPFNIQREVSNEVGIPIIVKDIEVFKINMAGFNLSNTIKLYTAPKLDGTTYESETVPIDYLEVVQDYPTFDSWSPVESIVITSNTIPVFSSSVSANHSFINGVEVIEQQQFNLIDFALTDFKAGNYEGGVLYNPNEKRWLNLTNQDELKLISLEVFYRNKLTGQLIPLKINSGGAFSIKFVFRKPAPIKTFQNKPYTF